MPDGLIGMVGLVIAIECAVAHFCSIDICRSHLPLSWRKSSQSVASNEAKAEILCFGDSLVKLGVLPRVIEDRLGVSAYNLAVLAGQPASSFFLFRQVLESGHRPRAVIVDFSAPILTMPLRTNLEGWAELATCRDTIELALEAGDPALGFAIASRWLVPSRSRQATLRPALAVGQEHDRTGSTVVDRRVFERNWSRNRGAQVAPRQFVPIAGALPAPPKEGEYQWRPKPVHAAYVARFLSLAKSHGIPVYWVLPPVVASRRERLESSGVVAAYDAFVVSFATAYAGLTILDGNSLDWGARAFRDPIHLNRDGAVAFSLAIARSLARRLGRADRAGLPRWVRLDAPLDISGQPWERLLEDLDESRRAFEQNGRVATGKEGSKWSRNTTAIQRKAGLGGT
ncbi:MAG TPA: hypothetical protein VKA15_05050 [Isosphaeraceae bacterium]|nr:hypothetical protein [Isosphaeraceae bacterium]